MKKDKAIILSLRKMANEHKKISELYCKAAADLEYEEGALTEVGKNLSSDNVDFNKTILLKPNNLTTEQIVLEIFEDKVPRTSKQLLSEFNIISGRQLKYSAFSCQLSNLKKQDVVCSQKFTIYRLEHKHIYGLPGWFENGELKKEFLDKFEY